MPRVMTLTSENFDREVTQSHVPVLVDYWAPWCGPCRIVGPIVEQIAAERAGDLRVGKVNVDEQPDLAAMAGVQGIPYVVLYENGMPVASAVGARAKAALEHALRLDAPADAAA